MNREARPDFVIRGVSAQLGEGPVPGWRVEVLYSGPTAYMDELFVHVGVLGGGMTPHPPHTHDHEEMHVTLSERIEHVTRDAVSGEERTTGLSRGAAFFTDSSEPHTFRNAGDEPAP